MDVVYTEAGQPFPIRKTNSTDASYPTRVSTTTMPAGIGDAAAQTTRGTFTLAGIDGGKCANAAIFQPFGTTTNDTTFLMRILGWRYFAAGKRGLTGLPFWYYTNLCEFTCTLSSGAACVMGVTDGAFSASNLFCDTIALVGTSGNDDVSIDIVSPANDTPAHVVVDMKGASIGEVIFDRNSSAASANCMVQLLS